MWISELYSVNFQIIILIKSEVLDFYAIILSKCDRQCFIYKHQPNQFSLFIILNIFNYYNKKKINFIYINIFQDTIVYPGV